MVRKLKKNTIRAFGILTAIVVIVIITFGVFIYKYMSYDKTKYDIAVGSVLYDEDQNYILTEGDAYITQKMNKKYYLYEKKDGNTYKHVLGKNAVVYKENDTNLYLYGVGYQVLSSGDVNVVEGETRIVKSSPTKLFKLDDRKYLIVDNNITSKDSDVLKTTGYVIINLDKQGNPSFANNLLSFKTVAQVVLAGSNLNFDVPNETMIFNDKKVDLKNIIGSTNEYDPTKVTKLSGNTDPSLIDGTETANGIEGSGNGGSGDGEEDEDNEFLVNNYYDEYLNAVIKSINNLTASVGGVNDNTNVSLSRTAAKYYDFSRWVALKSVSSDATSITIGYSVFDPSNEYQSVYLVIDDNEQDTRILDKDATSYTILDRKPGTSYKVSLVYTLVGENMATVKDIVTVRTKEIKYTVKVNKVSKNSYLVKETNGINFDFHTKYKIEYEIEVDPTFKFNTAKLELVGENDISSSQDGYTKTQLLTASDIGSNGVYKGYFELDQDAPIANENTLTLKDMLFCVIQTDSNSSSTGDCGIDSESTGQNLGLEFSYKFYYYE